MADQNSAQSQVDEALKASPPQNDKPLDLNQLVFKTMPKGYVVPKDYVAPQAAAAPQPVVPAASLAAITGNATTAVPAATQPASAATTLAPAPSMSTAAPIQPAHSRMGLWLWIIGLVVLIAAAVVLYLFFMRKPVAVPSTQPTAPATQSTTPSTSTPVTPTTPVSTDTTPTIAPSVIDLAWLNKYFPTDMVSGVCPAQNQGVCGDAADPDSDGLTNAQEFKANTDPTMADTDADGIADGDELNVFLTDPLNMHTSGVVKYSDSGDITNKYNSVAKAPFTPADFTRIAAAIKQYGLHQPTTHTLSQDIIEFYTNYGMTQ